MTWTRFFDMHSGGNRCTDYDVIWIEADQETAARVFERRFGFEPYGVSCSCCGDDYSISEENEYRNSLHPFDNGELIITKDQF